METQNADNEARETRIAALADAALCLRAVDATRALLANAPRQPGGFVDELSRLLAQLRTKIIESADVLLDRKQLSMQMLGSIDALFVTAESMVGDALGEMDDDHK